jgi:hypothetical protein
MHMEGQGMNYGRPVTFVIDSVDNGDGAMPGTFAITTSDGCHGGGKTSGGSRPRYRHDG